MQADAAAAQAVAQAPKDPDVVYKRAVIDALAGRRDAALQALQRAIHAGYSAHEAREDYDLAALRASAEFQALVNKPD